MWGTSLNEGDVWPTVSAPVPRRSARRRNAFPEPSLPENHLPTYFDCGDASHLCRYFLALFWYDERVLCSSRRGNLSYNQCCKAGTVVLPPPVMPPSEFVTLYQDLHFMSNIRAYNSLFSMTSFGAEIDTTVNDSHGPYTFKVSGQVSHYIGSLCPQPPNAPRFLQLYVYDTLNEVENRLRVFRSTNTDDRLKPEIVAILTRVLPACNEYVRTFKRAVEVANFENLHDFAVRLYNNVPDNRYGLPQQGTLGAIVVADDANATAYDIIIRSNDNQASRISKLHQSYMPLQYPLLFPYGEVGWSPQLKLRSGTGSNPRCLTVNMYYSYLLHDRHNVFSLLLRGGRLFQQFLLDAYLCLEDSRLDYFRNHQNSLRSEYVSGVYDALSRGDSVGKQIGKRIFLPASFVGGPRYMYKHYQDALALCRVFGNPQYFITFTCNARWPEIIRFMDANDVGQCHNRPDIVSRIFSIKVAHFVNFLKEEKPFGAVNAYLYTIEFQKRGLPHCHTLLWVNDVSKIRDASDVDKYITAELPNPVTEPNLYSTITTCMIHGPCGLSNLAAPCMREGICKKKFPKPFSTVTSFDENGYVHYKRNDVTAHTMHSGARAHNGFIVPYNKAMCSRFNAHINVEYCGWNMMIKYLFKYISKGVERVAFSLQKTDLSVSSSTSANKHSLNASSSTSVPETVNEIEQFIDGRFICPHEAAWRLLNFSIHERQPAVQVLQVHLEDMQSVTFKDNCELQHLIGSANFGNSTLSRWLITNRWDSDGRHLTYVEFPSLFTWNAGKKDWIFRSKNTITPVGRMVYIHSTAGEVFYLRMLLCHQRGCRCFNDIRTVAGVVYSSYRLACEALGLIGDDREWLTAFKEAADWASSPELRTLFCSLLLYCDVGDPKLLWNNAWSKMGDDITRLLSNSATNSDFTISQDVLQQHILSELEKLLNAATPPKSLTSFSLPLPSSSLLIPLTNRLLLEETLYNQTLLGTQYLQMYSTLNSDQIRIFDIVRNNDLSKKQSLLFVYGHGGTGKTFLWSTILAYFRSTGRVVLAVASSGIASLLLPNGRTAHSHFNIPINLLNTSVCNIKKKTHLCQLLQQTEMIIWDEATMMDRMCFECVDRTLRDILEKRNEPFGGISVLLGGDFRQTLPIKRKKGHRDIMLSTLPHSHLWQHFSLYKLSHNMRVTPTDRSQVSHSNSLHFAKWLLDVGNGNLGIPDTANPRYVSNIQIPDDFLITDNESGLDQLIDFVYGSAVLLDPTPEILCSRAIVCPKNCTADEINSTVLNNSRGTVSSYYSADSITPHTQRMSDLDLLYPEEYLNQLNFPGLPLHKLDLKKNVPILLLRNINQKKGLCNGTRLLVTRLLPTIIEAVIMTGTCIGQKTYLPRIKFVHHDPELPFAFNRKQFPCKISYAMTINKSQGQSLQRIGVFLPTPVFGHGQLYVALSRATAPESLKILIHDENGKCSSHTKNMEDMVYIADLEYGCTGLPLEIRILRKWTPHFRNKETWFLSVDEHGDTITILGEQQGQRFLQSTLQVQKCYIIEHYSCSETEKYQKMIKNSIHLNAGEASNITAIEDKKHIPKTSFNFASIDELQSFVKTPAYYPDFLGKLRRQTLLYKKDGDPFLLLTLTDTAGQEIIATIWKECMADSEKVDTDALSAATSDTTIALTNIKPMIYTEALKISSTDATHIIIDPPLQSQLKQQQQLPAPGRTNTSSNSQATMTLEELQSKPYEVLLRKVVATNARIIDTNIENCWYIASCPDCRTHISKQKELWFCPNHGPRPNPNFFYNVRVTLSDGISNLEAMATDSCMQKLIGRSCKQIITEDGYDERKILPPAFMREGVNTHRYQIEMTKKSNPNNINFVIINKETIPNETPTPQSDTDTPKLPDTPSTTTDLVDITPPPYTPTTPNTNTKSPPPESAEKRKQEHHQPQGNCLSTRQIAARLWRNQQIANESRQKQQKYCKTYIQANGNVSPTNEDVTETRQQSNLCNFVKSQT